MKMKESMKEKENDKGTMNDFYDDALSNQKLQQFVG